MTKRNLITNKTKEERKEDIENAKIIQQFLKNKNATTEDELAYTKARYELYESAKLLAYNMAHKVYDSNNSNFATDFDDLAQELNLELWNRTETYLPDKGAKFITYVYPFLLKKAYSVKVNQRVIRIGEYGTGKIMSELNEGLNEMSYESFNATLSSYTGFESLENLIYEDANESTITVADIVPDKSLPNLDNNMVINEILKELSPHLSKKEQAILNSSLESTGSDFTDKDYVSYRRNLNLVFKKIEKLKEKGLINVAD